MQSLTLKTANLILPEIMNLPTLSRNTAFIKSSGDDEASLKAQYQKPDHQCFCCFDKGLILDVLVRKIIPEYDPKYDYFPVCNRNDCRGKFNIPDPWESQLDRRFTAEICEELHQINLSSWNNLVEQKAHLIKQNSQQINKFCGDFKA